MNGGSITLYKVIDQAAPGANTDIVSAGITVPEGGALRISVSLATASVFNLMVTAAGGTQRAIGLNQSVALNAGDGYTFPWSAIKVDQNGAAVTYNFQVETNGIIRYLVVELVTGAVI